MNLLYYFGTVVILQIQIISYSSAIFFDEGCYIDEAPLLQMAFVMDQTGTFFGAQGGSNFFIEFQKLAPTLLEAIEKDYPGAQFALTSHGDWERSAEPEQHPKADPHQLREGCYTRAIKFTTDRARFQNDIGKVKVLSSGLRENALPALAFTAADKEIGWIRNATTSDGKMVRRVMVLITDRDSGETLNKPGRRGDFKGDGTDTCSTSKIPGNKILKEVFENYQTSVIALLAISEGSGNLTEIYERRFKGIGANIRYCGRTFALKTRGAILTNITSQELIPKDFWANQKAMSELEDEDEMESKKEKLESLNKAALALDIKASQYDHLIKFVTDCLRETKTDGCVFGDPEGVNTLGF